MEEVKRRRSGLGELKKPQWTTSCSLQLPGFERLNIQVETDLALLAIAAFQLESMEEAICRAEERFDASIAHTWKGYVITDWISDIGLRIRITQMQSEQQRLEALERCLDALLSQDQRREMELAKIETELDG